MSAGDTLQRTTRGQEDADRVCQPRDDDLGDPRKDGVGVERGGEQLSGLGEHAQALVGLPLAGDVHDHGTDAGDPAVLRAHRVVARKPVPPVARPEAGLVRRLVVDDGLAGLEHLPIQRLECGRELGLDVGERLAGVLRRGQVVDLGQRFVDSDEAKLAIPEADPDRSGDQERVELRVGRLDRRVERRVLDAECDPAGDLCREERVVGRVPPSRFSRAERKRPERAAANDQRDDDVRGGLEAAIEIEVALVESRGAQHRFVDVLDQKRRASREHLRGRVLRVAIGWIQPPDRAQQRLLLRICVLEHGLAKRLSFLDEVDDAVVGDRRHDHVAEPRQRQLEIQGRGEDRARALEEPHPLAGASVLGDVVKRVDRKRDRACLVAHGCRPHDRPALLPRLVQAVADGSLLRAPGPQGDSPG